jgi:hypothetical protein
MDEDELTIWIDGDIVAESEAACIKLKTGQSKCITRIIKSETKDPAKSNANKNVSKRPNILLVLLDPISRAHFERAMTKTRRVLRELDFIEFAKYTAVGPNSGPNQAALYSGVPLESRNGIGQNLHGEKWLWDQLRDSGYITLKAEDGCVENSNMIQSLVPNTTHGSALAGLFCFDSFSRPNCIGPDPASALLFQYSEQFISTYENSRRSNNPNLRWASFLHFTDSHEDTMLLAGTIDEGLSKFLKNLETSGSFENSVVVLCSDHGLHYGPMFESRQGRREATEPILHVRIPAFLREDIDMNIVRNNSVLWTTPFDLHETLLHLTQTAHNTPMIPRRGISLAKPLPSNRQDCKTTSDLIPIKYCDLQQGEEMSSIEHPHATMPSLDSFFLDIPLNRRPRLNLDLDCKNPNSTASQAKKFDLCPG